MPTQTRPRISAATRDVAHRKSAIRALRSGGMVPGSIFGHGDPQNIQVSARALQEFLTEHASGALMDLELGGKSATAVIRTLERDPVTGRVIHIGLQRVDLGETIHAAVPVHYVGEELLIKEQYVLERQIDEVDVNGRADQIPEALTVDVRRKRPGDLIHISDLQMPSGITPTRTPDTIVARVTSPKVAPDVEAALEAEEAAHQALVASHGAEEAEETTKESVGT